MHFPEIDLPKVANVAGSAVALIIATAILLSWITARYVPSFERFRGLTDEFRNKKDVPEERRNSLYQQIEDYRSRLWHMNRATDLLCIVMVLAVLTIVFASTTVALPPKEKMTSGEKITEEVLTLVGCFTLFFAFVLDIAAICLVVLENRLDRHAIETEVQDIRDSGTPAR